MKFIYAAIAALALTTAVSATDANATPRNTHYTTENGGRYKCVQVAEPSSLILLGAAVSSMIAARRFRKDGK